MVAYFVTSDILLHKKLKKHENGKAISCLTVVKKYTTSGSVVFATIFSLLKSLCKGVRKILKLVLCLMAIRLNI